MYEEVERKYVRGGEKKLKNDYDILCKIKKVLVDDKRHIRFGEWNAADIEVGLFYYLLTFKVFLCLVKKSTYFSY